MDYTLLSSPLQGFTDFRFRNAQNKYFGGIDTYYSPYIRLNGKLIIKSSYERDLLPENNVGLEVIPQVITNDADEFLFVAKYVQQLGYKELNWNLGCPYPMVTKSGMGSGLISNTEKINSILDRTHSESDIIVSMKMRLGYDNTEEILDVLHAEMKANDVCKFVQAVVLFDEYRGKGLDLDEKSLAFRFTLQDTHNTLQDEQVEAAMSALINAVQTKTHARLR